MDITNGSTYPDPPPTFREYVERLLAQFGDYSVIAFNWQNEIMEIPTSGMYVKYAPTGAVELHFSLDVRHPEPVPWAKAQPSDQSGDYESAPDLDVLIGGTDGDS